MKNELVLVNPIEFGIEEKKANELIGNLPQIVSERTILEEQFNEVIKLDIDDPETSVQAKSLRLLIQKNRTQGINIWHKTTKDFFLKGGQFVDAMKRKEIAVNERMENDLMQIEKHAEILEQKRLEALQIERVNILSSYVEDANERDLSYMDIDVWNAYLSVKKQAYNDKIEAEKKAEEERIEKERLIKLHNDRKNSILDLWQFVEDEIKDTDFSDLNDTDWIDFVEALRNEKLKFDEDQEKIRKENERLYKEKKAKEEKEAALKLRNDKRNKELRPYIVFIRDYNKMLDLDEKAYQKELLDIKEGAKLQYKFDVKEAQKKADKEAKELREKENLRLRLQAKEEKERKEKQRLLNEQMQKTKAEKAARLAPDKDKLLKFADDLNNLELPELKSVEASEILKNIVNLLGKTTGYIKEKAKSL